MSGAIPPLPLKMWYSVKAQGQLYFYLYAKVVYINCPFVYVTNYLLFSQFRVT